MEVVLFNKLILRGFGLYADEAVFEFGPGPNVLWGPNESGKSTMAAGLAAVLFGLAVSGDASGFTTERYRNWQQEQNFEGEVMLTVGTKLYHIRRRFEDNAIVVRRRGEKGEWQELISGTHNPRAIKPNVTYLRFLREQISIESLDVFRQTYFVEQPLPSTDKLDEKVQQLLSGGGSQYKAVLKELIASLKEVTMDWNTYCSSLNSGRTERKLDSLKRQQRELEQEVKVQSLEVGELTTVVAEIEQVGNERNTLKRSLGTQQKVLSSFQQWLTCRDRYEIERRRVRATQTALKQAQELITEQAILQKQVDGAENVQEHYQKREQYKVELVLLEPFASLGSNPGEAIFSARLWLKEKIQQKSELSQAVVLAEQEQQEARGLCEQAEQCGEAFRGKYGASPQTLPDNSPELLQQRSSVEEGRHRLITQLARAKSKPRRQWWPLFTGLALGIVALFVPGETMGMAMALILTGAGVLTAVLWRQDPAEAAVYQREISHIAEQAKQLEHQLPLVAALVPEHWPLAREELLQYRELSRKANDSCLVAAAELAENKGKYEQFVDRLSRVMPERHYAVLGLLGIDSGGEGLLGRVENVNQATWEDLEEQAKRFALVTSDLQDIGHAIMRIETAVLSKLREKGAALRQIFSTYSVDTVEGLNDLAEQQAGEVYVTLKDWRTLIDGNPGLPGVDAARDPLVVTEVKLALEEKVRQHQLELDRLEARMFELRQRQGILEGKTLQNVAQGADHLHELAEEEAMLMREARALGIAIDELEAAAGEFQSSYRERLAERATFHFARIAGLGRGVVLDEEFSIGVRTEDGKLIVPGQLSQGTQDQLYLALRLAIADLTSQDKEPPLIFDDPFLTSDGERLTRIQEALANMNRQSVLLTHSPRFAGWGTAVVRR
ncbi:MAG: hypothetical protein FD169_1123 [Bacillota bacterium]|nr:MAG: hypothetical protein FD169_1123 [Bacillota bacterium]MBS3949493.1 AAA family ATPase [Peptococcaceae bacterium]